LGQPEARRNLSAAQRREPDHVPDGRSVLSRSESEPDT
jgi:hypothetical protein